MLGGEQQGGDYEIAGRVGHIIGEGSQSRPETLAFEPSGQCRHVPANRRRCDGGGGCDGLFQACRSRHGVAQHLGPSRHRLDPGDRGCLRFRLGKQCRDAPAGRRGEQSGNRPTGDRRGERRRTHRDREAQSMTFDAGAGDPVRLTP